jgi:hypothetical protein
MKEPRFIELLNLYVDQQLSASEAAELESEIKQNPARRRIYQQYCRMQKACAQLFEHERSTAPASATLAREIVAAERKVVGFPVQTSDRPFWSTGFSIAAVAAAACVAFVVVRQADTAAPGAGNIEVAATDKPAVATSTVPAVPVVAAVATTQVNESEEFKPIFTTQALRAPVKANSFFVSAVKQEESSGIELDWTRQVQLEPVRKVSSEDFVFGLRPSIDKAVTAGFQTTGSSEEHAVEQAAFQFQR